MTPEAIIEKLPDSSKLGDLPYHIRCTIVREVLDAAATITPTAAKTEPDLRIALAEERERRALCSLRNGGHDGNALRDLQIAVALRELSR